MIRQSKCIYNFLFLFFKRILTSDFLVIRITSKKLLSTRNKLKQYPPPALVGRQAIISLTNSALGLRILTLKDYDYLDFRNTVYDKDYTDFQVTGL